MTRQLTPELIQARNDALARGRATRAANIAAKKAAYQQRLDVAPSLYASPDNPEAPIEPELQVDVNIPDIPQHKVSLKDRLFGGKASATPTKKPVARGRGGKKSEDNNLITTVLPTIIAGFIATYAYDKLPDPYKVCAPSKQEVNSILGPVMAIIARRIEVTGKASQDAIDIANALICSFAYGTRAYITYVQIKRMEESSGTQENSTHTGTERTGNHQGSGHAVSRDSSGGDDVGRGSITAISDYINVSDGVDDVKPDANPESELFAAMFARDKRGRTQLGLLPG